MEDGRLHKSLRCSYLTTKFQRSIVLTIGRNTNSCIFFREPGGRGLWGGGGERSLYAGRYSVRGRKVTEALGG